MQGGNLSGVVETVDLASILDLALKLSVDHIGKKHRHGVSTRHCLKNNSLVLTRPNVWYALLICTILIMVSHLSLSEFFEVNFLHQFPDLRM